MMEIKVGDVVRIWRPDENDLEHYEPQKYETVTVTEVFGGTANLEASNGDKWMIEIVQ